MQSCTLILIFVACCRYNDEIELEDAVHTAILTVSIKILFYIIGANRTDMAFATCS